MSELPCIPGYRLIREIGSGGMATVYLAVQEKLNREVAVKVLSPALQADRDFTHRFVREARTAANLRHAHIVAVHDVGRHGSIFFMVMEHLPESLKDRMVMKFGQPFSPREVLAVLGPIAAALEYAHQQGVVHRDIKPDNIMFRADGTPVLVDFGLAKATSAPGRHTDTRLAIGTPHYMSPEQGMGKPLDARSDFYSLGVVLYEMLTGRVPYEADSAMGVVFKHVQDPLPRLPPAMAAFQPLIERLLAKEPEQRLRTADELRGRLERIAGERQASPAPPPPPRRRLPRRTLPLLGALAVLAFVSGFLLTRRPAAPVPPAARHPTTSRPGERPRPVSTVPPATATDASEARAVQLARARASLDGNDLETAHRLLDAAGRVGPSGELDELRRQVREREAAAAASPRTAPAAPQPTRRGPPGEAPASPLQLRSGGIEVGREETRDMLRRFAFFDRYENGTGDCRARFQRRVADGLALVEDPSTGLTWWAAGSAHPMPYAAVPAWLADVNAGDGGWRLPTVEEAASLLSRIPGRDGLHVSPLFSPAVTEAWTADRLSGSAGKVWVVLFGDGCLGVQAETARSFVRPVRGR